jgi:hypothetical protein
VPRKLYEFDTFILSILSEGILINDPNQRDWDTVKGMALDLDRPPKKMIVRSDNGDRHSPRQMACVLLVKTRNMAIWDSFFVIKLSETQIG